MLPRAFVFDLDMTLVDSSALESLRSQQNWSAVMANLSRLKPFDGSGVAAHELPRHVRERGARVAVVTAAPRQYAEAVLKLFQIDHDALVAYGDTPQHKPDPEPINAALKLLGAQATDAVHVGDAAIDVEASYHAGVFSVGAGWGVADHDAFSSTAPDALFMDPATLLAFDRHGQHGYFAEAIAQGVQPAAHAGSFFQCGASRYALGRYFSRADPRHAQSHLSKLLLHFKNDDAAAPAFAQALAAFITSLNWKPTHLVGVPPKPSQPRNRFKSLLDAVQVSLGAGVRVIHDGLRCSKDITGYKSLGPLERAAEIRNAFESNYGWTNCRILLVDDVVTTGETSSECARVLLADGAAEVRIVALGRDQRTFIRKQCSACGRTMKVRTNSSTGENFWGCSGYPNDCTNTEDM